MSFLALILTFNGGICDFLKQFKSRETICSFIISKNFELSHNFFLGIRWMYRKNKKNGKNLEKLSHMSTKLCYVSVIKTESNRMKFCSVSGCHQNNKYTVLGIDKNGTHNKYFRALPQIGGRVLNLPGKYSLLIRTFWQTSILHTKLKCWLKKVTFWPNWIIPNTSLLLPEINNLNEEPHWASELVLVQ